MHRPLENSYWVLPGRLLAGEYPGAESTERNRQRLQALQQAGIDSFVDLTLPGEMHDYQSLLPAHVQYWRSGIADASVPADPEQMRTIQSHLQAALADGRNLYVHCRAGIGRTGMVVGCYLAQQSLDGEIALRQLNQLWTQCARSALWPIVPQTQQQADFIRAWPQYFQPDSERPQMAALQELRTRFLGSLLGLAIGDALGAPTQFRRPGSFALIGDLLGGGPFDLARGDWSDDTAMALTLVDSLLESAGFDPADQLRRLRRWQRLGHLSASGVCVGISAATARVLASDRPPPPDVGASAEAAPLSRVAPVVLYDFADPSRALLHAAAAARLFEATALVADACRLLAAMLYTALRGESLAQVLRPPLLLLGPQPLAPAIKALYEQDPMQIPRRGGEPALDALAGARWALASGGGFRAGALRAANLGGDSDVIGAVHGQLAGALYGHQAIPSGWLAALAARERIEAMADRLLTAALVGLAAEPG